MIRNTIEILFQYREKLVFEGLKTWICHKNFHTLATQTYQANHNIRKR